MSAKNVASNESEEVRTEFLAESNSTKDYQVMKSDRSLPKQVTPNPRKRNRGTATVVTEDEHIKKLISENSKKVKKEPKEKSNKTKSKPKIIADKLVKKPITVRKKPNADAKLTPRQPLADFNYQHPQEYIPLNIVQQCNPEIPEQTFHTAGTGFLNATIVDGTLMFQSNNGQYEPIYRTDQL